ncbi:MAG: ImmA/IrrE family metallo-endopeptidase [Rhodospirillales bacterium]|nr:ImmA/IrrE family metallo-endopeptidase [Rhodospirillales bacterium]
MILYHPNQSPTRFESTIMHELAHLLLKHPSGELYLAPDGSYERDFDRRWRFLVFECWCVGDGSLVIAALEAEAIGVEERAQRQQ